MALLRFYLIANLEQHTGMGTGKEKKNGSEDIR